MLPVAAPHLVSPSLAARPSPHLAAARGLPAAGAHCRPTLSLRRGPRHSRPATVATVVRRSASDKACTAAGASVARCSAFAVARGIAVACGHPAAGATVSRCSASTAAHDVVAACSHPAPSVAVVRRSTSGKACAAATAIVARCSAFAAARSLPVAAPQQVPSSPAAQPLPRRDRCLWPPHTWCRHRPLLSLFQSSLHLPHNR